MSRLQGQYQQGHHPIGAEHCEKHTQQVEGDAR